MSSSKNNKFKWYGTSFLEHYKGDKGKYRWCISKTSWKRLKEKIKVITRKTSPILFQERIKRLNYLMRGWLNYFKYATGHEKLIPMARDGFVDTMSTTILYLPARQAGLEGMEETET